MKELITPCLWFDGKGKEAATFYCENFKGARISDESMIVTEFEVDGQRFICLDGGPMFTPNPSISFFYICETETEFDGIWKAFEKGGKVMMEAGGYPWSKKYGFIEDRYGISWQFSVGNLKDVGQRITPSLLFVGDQYGRAEEAIQHYASIFDGYKSDGIVRYGANEAPDKEGLVKHAQFALNGQKFMATDSAGPHPFRFSEGISLTIYCEDQEEIDYYWQKLTDGGQESMCGWLADKFGVWWQVVPSVLHTLMSDPNKAPKAMKAFMQMKKFNIEQILQASL
jgi:predicted 3-demethylubiquinone-9 3-methyltransferase (glyoxalase superfamily)